MALFKYYKLKEKLPKPDGPFSQSVPLPSILAANEEVRSGLSKLECECSGDDAQTRHFSHIISRPRPLFLLLLGEACGPQEKASELWD